MQPTIFATGNFYISHHEIFLSFDGNPSADKSCAECDIVSKL